MCIYANPHAFGVQVLLTLPCGGMNESCMGILEAGTDSDSWQRFLRPQAHVRMLGAPGLP